MSYLLHGEGEADGEGLSRPAAGRDDGRDVAGGFSGSRSVQVAPESDDVKMVPGSTLTSASFLPSELDAMSSNQWFPLPEVALTLWAQVSP